MGSWKGQASRQHVVSKVFPFSSTEPTEVMLYGLSKYVYEDQTTGEMGWAARLCFERAQGGSILISYYHIYPVSGIESGVFEIMLTAINRTHLQNRHRSFDG